MDFGSIEREIYIEASPAVVYEVVSDPEHVKDWWQAESDFEPVAGSSSELTWTDAETGATQSVAITIVDAQPPRRFVFRWTHPQGDVAAVENSLLVTFELVPAGSGTTLRMTETGFREQGWEIAKLEQQYQEHVDGWTYFLSRLAATATRLAGTR